MINSISNFQISGQLPKSKNYHNSRTSNDIDMKLAPVTKYDKRNTETSRKGTQQKIDDKIMSANCGVIFIFLI